MSDNDCNYCGRPIDPNSLAECPCEFEPGGAYHNQWSDYIGIDRPPASPLSSGSNGGPSTRKREEDDE